MKKTLIFILVAIIFLIIIINFIPDNFNKITGEIILEKSEEINESDNLFLVTKVIDGDTIKIETGEIVRLICIDTPEYDEEGYEIAKRYVESLILNKKVKLEKDKSETDKYNRILRYIYLEDGTFVNELIVKQGYGKVYWYKPDTTLCPIIQDAEDYAKRKDLGIWEESLEEESKEEIQQLEQNPPINLNIICSSNTYNCGDFSSYSEALNVFETCGGIDNDIYRLDRDEDGLPCESLK